MKKSKRQILKVCGGPWDGQKVLLPMNGTIVFRLEDWYGKYSLNGVWLNV